MSPETVLVFLVFLVFSISPSSAQVSGQNGAVVKKNKSEIHCLPPGRINASLVEGDTSLALKITQACIDEYRANSSNSSVFYVGYYFCAKSQIEAMAQDLDASARSLAEAEDYARDHASWFNSPLLNWSDVLVATKGLQLEKDGNTVAATKLYTEHKGHRSYSRLALLALKDGKDVEAERLARQSLALDKSYPTAHFVIAALNEKRGEQSEAVAEYRSALAFMVGPDNPEPNDFLPVRVAENALTKTALRRLQDGK